MCEKSQLGTPDYWKECTSQSGRKYYFNILTQQSIWEKPVAVFKVSDWTKEISKSGKIYYFNRETQKSIWTKPFDWVEEPLQVVSDNFFIIYFY